MQRSIAPQGVRGDCSFYKPAVFGFALALLAAVSGVMAPVGSRVGVWNYAFASQILGWTAFAGAVAVLLCLAGVVKTRPPGRRRGFVLSLVGLLVLVPVIVLPAYWGYAKTKFPPIQDISTDTRHPPEFWFAPNARMYGGPKTAALQRKAYPDIGPLVLSLPAEQAFDLALAVVRDKGWEVWVANPEEGRIEATEVTFWFGFSDDVSIRVTELDGGSRIDVRSASRFGSGGDGGANANRVRSFVSALKRRAGVEP